MQDYRQRRYKITLPALEIFKTNYLLKSLPYPPYLFCYSKKESEKLLKEVKNHYKKFVGVGNTDTILYFVKSRLKKEHHPDLEFVKKHNADHLNKDWQIPEGALWEQSDVVHDILTFLAEQMIVMNKEKQKEIRGFLNWFEGYNRIKIEDMKNKTKIKSYYGLNWNEFLDILVQNESKITKRNINDLKIKEHIEGEYENSLAKLNPLLDKIKSTDRLINQIVYKLYGLTDEEIAIVERENS